MTASETEEPRLFAVGVPSEGKSVAIVSAPTDNRSLAEDEMRAWRLFAQATGLVTPVLVELYKDSTCRIVQESPDMD